MSDLRTMMHEVGYAVPVAPAASMVDGDLARGRQALARNQRLRRNQRIRWGVPAGLVAASAAGLLIVGAHSPSVGPFTDRAVGTVTGQPKGEDSSTTMTISLVSYTGAQPAGYTIDKAPDGWRVQSIDLYKLVIAPIGVVDPAPTADQPATSFVGKIVIGKANDAEMSVERANQTMIKVGSVTARLFTYQAPEPEGAAETEQTQGLLLPVADGSSLIFQIPGSLHWDAATVAAFASGVHMNAAAEAALG